MFKASIGSVYTTLLIIFCSSTCHLFTLTPSTCTFLNYELLYTGEFLCHFIFTILQILLSHTIKIRKSVAMPYLSTCHFCKNLVMLKFPGIWYKVSDPNGRKKFKCFLNSLSFPSSSRAMKTKSVDKKSFIAYF